MARAPLFEPVINDVGPHVDGFELVVRDALEEDAVPFPDLIDQ
jgi:hypothetical protein